MIQSTKKEVFGHFNEFGLLGGVDIAYCDSTKCFPPFDPKAVSEKWSLFKEKVLNKDFLKKMTKNGPYLVLILSKSPFFFRNRGVKRKFCAIFSIWIIRFQPKCIFSQVTVNFGDCLVSSWKQQWLA